MAHTWTADDIPDQTGRHILITGANRGLGFLAAISLAAKNAELTLAVRDLAAGEKAAAKIKSLSPAATINLFQTDLKNLASVKEFANQVGALTPIDVLIHNAAAIMVDQSKTDDGYETHMGVNYIAPYALTLWLLPRLNAAPAARVVNMSSTAHKLTKSFRPDDFRFATGTYTAMEAYGRSKLADLLFTSGLNSYLRQTGAPTIAVACHPGYASTNPDLGGFGMRLATRLLAQKPQMGVLPMLYAATAAGVKENDFIGPQGIGELGGYPGPAKPAKAAQNPALAQQLWQATEIATGLRYPV